LLAFVAACDGLVGVSSVITLYYALIGNTQIEAFLCFWEMAPAILAFNLSLVFMLAIGLDRLFSVVFPIWYEFVYKSIPQHATPNSPTKAKGYCL
jgi:hypothetical protein